MPDPDRATLDAMTAFLKANLVKTACFQAGETFQALSETAVRFNETSWFWTDDNAKAAELFCEPGAYDADPAIADAALDFVLRMSQGTVIQRRGGPAELRVPSRDPAAFRVETAFFIVEGDLTRGVLRHALRFNDGRTLAAAAYGGNTVAFRHGGRRTTQEFERHITDPAVTLEDRAVVLSYASPLRSPGRDAVLGRVTCSYRVSADRPSIALTVTLAPAPGIVLQDVVVTTAASALGRIPRVAYRALGVRVAGRDSIVRDIRAGRRDLHAGPADYSAIVQEGGSPGFAYTVHTLHQSGACLDRIVGVARSRDRLDAVLNHYRLGTVMAEVPAIVREERMLTGGGYPDALGHYADVMRHARGGGEADPSMSYDVGAELNAVAAHILFTRRGCYTHPPGAERMEALTAWYDRHVERFFAFIRPEAPDALGRVFTRGIAFVVMSLDCMLRATGDERYRALLDTGVGLILRLARRRTLARAAHGIAFGDAWSPLGRFLDLHAACLLALARAAWHGDPDGRIARAIHEAVRGIGTYAGTVKLGPNHREPYQGLAMRNRKGWRTHVDTGFWTFKLGLVLRALHAVQRAAAAGVVPTTAIEAERVQDRLRAAERQVEASFRWHGDMLEVLTSPIAGETNSETQPWVALGLVPLVDARIAALPRLPARPGPGAPVSPGR